MIQALSPYCNQITGQDIYNELTPPITCIMPQWLEDWHPVKYHPNHDKMSYTVKAISVASCSVERSNIKGPIDMIKEALASCNDLRAPKLGGTFFRIEDVSLPDLSLHDIVLETWNSLLEITIHIIIQDHQDMGNHWYLWWSVLSMVIGLLVVTGCISIARIQTPYRETQDHKKI